MNESSSPQVPQAPSQPPLAQQPQPEPATGPQPGPGQAAPGDAGRAGNANVNSDDGSGFWRDLMQVGIWRDRNAGWFGGVCAGVAQRLQVDPLLIRALTVVLALTGGFGILIYLLAWLFLPDTDRRIIARELPQGGTAAIVLTVFASIAAIGALSWGSNESFGGWVVPTALIVIVFLFFRGRISAVAQAPGYAAPPAPQSPSATPTQAATPYQASTPQQATTSYQAAATNYQPSGTYPATSQPPFGASQPAVVLPPPPPPRPIRRRAPRGFGFLVLGGALAAFGIGFLLHGPSGFQGSPVLLGLLAALGVSAIAAITLGLTGRRGGIATLLTLALLSPVAIVSAIDSSTWREARDQAYNWAPTNDGDHYQRAAGKVTIDLTSFKPQPAGSSNPGANLPDDISPDATADIGAGQVTVLVQKGQRTQINARVGIGEIVATATAEATTNDSATTRDNGLGVTRTITTAGTGTNPPTTVQVNVGLGEIIIKEK